jgi:uncharacterized membrane-anchored protein
MLIATGLLLALGVPNIAIVRKERLLASGTSILLELAPVDPRSLIQGDYMRLDYAITRTLEGASEWPRDGHLVVRVDENGVGHFVRRHRADTPLANGERLVLYRRRGGRVRVGTDAFHFQEGAAGRYETARYGELRVDDSGASVLVGLRDAARSPLN